MSEIMKELQNFKKYVGKFEFDLIIMSVNRIAIINQRLCQYIEWHDSVYMIDILEHFINSQDNLQEIFHCHNIKFSTDMYLKEYLSDMQQVV